MMIVSPTYVLFQFFVVFGPTFTAVNAHGYIHSITLDGVTYQGADPYGSAISSPIRQVSSNSPATPVYGDIQGVAMACGGDAKAASMTVPVSAGSDVSIYWGSWPHNVGPIITYLGKCDGSCATTDPTKVDFFKIHQVDFVPGTHTWVQSQTLYKGLPFNFTLPEDLPNGDFIMRHEVIALHNAMNQGGAEIFPQCIQVSVDCGGGKIPAATGKFPGAYSATDPGILINVYDDPNNLVYRFPGPVLALEEDPEDDGDDPSSTSSSSSATSTPPTTSTSSSSSASVSSTNSAGSSTTITDTSSTTSVTSTSSSSSSSPSSSSSATSAASTPTSASASTSDTYSSTDSGSVSTTASSDASTTTQMTSTTARRTRTRRPTTTASPQATTSSSSTSAQTSTTSTTSSADPTESVSMDLQNGRDAIALNHKYQSVVAGTSCTNYDIGCIGDAFAQCVWGTWVATKCPTGTVCAALPNVGTPGTSITCTTPADRDMRIAITGATLKMKRHRKHNHIGSRRH